MCAITSRMHAVCDERGNYLFKSVGSLAGRLRPGKGADNQQDLLFPMNIGNNLGPINMCMHGVFLHANRVCTVHTACSGLFNFLQGANSADVILGI